MDLFKTIFLYKGVLLSFHDWVLLAVSFEKKLRLLVVFSLVPVSGPLLLHKARRSQPPFAQASVTQESLKHEPVFIYCIYPNVRVV